MHCSFTGINLVRGKNVALSELEWSHRKSKVHGMMQEEEEDFACPQQSDDIAEWQIVWLEETGERTGEEVMNLSWVTVREVATVISFCEKWSHEVAWPHFFVPEASERWIMVGKVTKWLLRELSSSGLRIKRMKL